MYKIKKFIENSVPSVPCNRCKKETRPYFCIRKALHSGERLAVVGNQKQSTVMTDMMKLLTFKGSVDSLLTIC